MRLRYHFLIDIVWCELCRGAEIRFHGALAVRRHEHQTQPGVLLRFRFASQVDAQPGKVIRVVASQLIGSQ